MKKTLSLFLSLALLFSLAACGPKETQAPTSSASSPVSSSTAPDVSQPGVPEPEARTQVNMMVLSGPTGVGAAKLMLDNNLDHTLNDYNFEVVSENAQVVAALTSGETDIAAIATNMAANLANQTDGGIQVLAINTLGVLYVLEKGESVQSISDLQGRTIWATGKGANPEFILNKLLADNGVEAEIEWLTPQEINANMLESEDGVCMLPVPAATALGMQGQGTIRFALSLSDIWEETVGTVLPMGCVVARTEFIQQNPQAVTDFLEEYTDSIVYMQSGDAVSSAPGVKSQLVADLGLTANADIAFHAIPMCNLTFIAGEEMRNQLQTYYQVLFQADPSSIGGMLPYDDFYYIP